MHRDASGVQKHVNESGPRSPGRVSRLSHRIPSEPHIDADRLAVVFEPFEQERVSDAALGSGLGLSIARRLARLMGGDLTVRSQIGAGAQSLLGVLVAAFADRPGERR